MWFKKSAPKKRVFGFPCTPAISDAVRSMARSLGLPIFCLSEHALQIGGAVVLGQLEDEQATKKLRDHLINCHLLVDMVDTDNDYDKTALQQAKRKQLERQGREKVISALVGEVENAGMPPRLIIQAVQMLLKEAARRGNSLRT